MYVCKGENLNSIFLIDKRSVLNSNMQSNILVHITFKSYSVNVHFKCNNTFTRFGGF